MSWLFILLSTKPTEPVRYGFEAAFTVFFILHRLVGQLSPRPWLFFVCAHGRLFIKPSYLERLARVSRLVDRQTPGTFPDRWLG
ncbi:hypothetical protein [Paenibacillus tuaregi]|uniref:hypothetical protein n=1 Tax=Paenibacillus tuaregi TaxID=1816681 RepID=UPI0011DE24CB|nr:hypothetical protein [Paenibacillus tuaregi]